MTTEHPNIAKREWRLQAISTLSEPFISPTGNKYEAGTAVELVGFLKSTKKVISIPVPNAAAMYLSVAKRLLASGLATVAPALESAVKIPSGTFDLPRNHETALFDALESLSTTVICAYSALEVFANEAVPDDFRYTRKRKDDRCEEVFAKPQIERHISLDEKLGEVVPVVRSVRSPRGTKIWQSFVHLSELRDRLIHLKTPDWRSSGPDRAEEWIWTRVLEVAPTAPTVSLALMRHFHPTDPPRWLDRATKAL